MALTGKLIVQLEAGLQAIERKLETRGLAEREADRLLDRHEVLLNLIANAPARDLSDLEIKLMCLASLLFPGDVAADTGIEHALFCGILDDIKILKAR